MKTGEPKMKKEKLKLVKREITEKDLGFRMRLEPNDYLALRGYAEKHDVKISDVVLSALRQCGVITAPRTARHGKISLHGAEDKQGR